MSVNGQRSARATTRLIAQVYATPRYRGKRVVIIHGRAFPSPKGSHGLRHLQRLLTRYPGEQPTIVYVPAAETLILTL
jgi:hypothetical protein